MTKKDSTNRVVVNLCDYVRRLRQNLSRNILSTLYMKMVSTSSVMSKIIGWGGVTFPPLQKSVIKIQTREWLEKTHKSVLLTNDT